MDEIIFKGKRKDNGHWVKGSLLHCDLYDGDEINLTFIIPIFDYYDEDMQLVEVIPETVGQYIGLKDCNGNKIYEGDILKSVVYRIGAKPHFIKITDIRHAEKIALHVSNYEIYSNIHDNPEIAVMC